MSGRKNYAFARAGLTFARGRRYEHDTCGSIEAELGDVKEMRRSTEVDVRVVDDEEESSDEEDDE